MTEVPGAVPAPLELSTSDAALSLQEARAFTGQRGALTALMLGEVGSGKTTLLVETWTALMAAGSVGHFQFAGSVTALAFEERAFDSRIESGAFPGETVRTAEEDDGFLHLRLSRAGTRTLLPELLLADVTGEHSRQIREGVPLEDELAWAARVDRFVVLVDGAAFRDPTSRENALNRARRLLHALRTSAAVAASCRVAVVLSKADALRAADRRAWRAAEQALLDLARATDPGAQAFATAARPADHSAPVGLADLLGFLLSPDRVPSVPPVPSVPRPARAMSRVRR